MALILGKPGGGKGTISSKILADFPEFSHTSTGDAFRRHVREGTAIGTEVKDYMDRGELVPDKLVSALVVEDVRRVVLEEGGSLLLDGFPRTVAQAETLERAGVAVDFALHLNVPTETIVERVSDRWIAPSTGRVYSYSYRPPRVRGKDDDTGEDLVRREDDEPSAVRRRLAGYDDATKPLVDFYRGRGVLEDFFGTQSDVIYVDVKRSLEERLPGHVAAAGHES